MKFEEFMATVKEPETPDEIRQLTATIMSLEDIPSNERDAFQCGYIAGLSYALSADKQDAATELLLQMHESDS